MEDVAAVTEAITDAALVLGRTPAEVHRANIALGQIASKGQVYAEELKGQLAEAIPGALPLAAKAYGVTVAQFNKMVADGLVDSASFFKKFSRQLKAEYGDAAKAAANTTRVAAGQLSNAWFNAKVAIGSGDLDKMFMRILKAATKLFTELTKKNAFATFGSNLAKAMEPLVVRFEKAVGGAYDFNRVLNGIVATFKFLVGGVNLALDVLHELSLTLTNVRAILKGYGIELPSVSNGIRTVFGGLRQVTEALSTRKTPDNGYVHFFASLYIAIESCVYALARLVFPDGIFDDADTMEKRFERMANWLDQLSRALVSLYSGKVDPGLNDTGVGILTRLVEAVDKVRQLRNGIKEAYALLSGKDAPEGADLATQRRFAMRDKVGDLFAGRENETKRSTSGEVLVPKDSLDTLFTARDLLKEIVDFLVANKTQLAEFFNGALAAMNGVLAVGRLIVDTLSFFGVDANIPYLLGMYYLLNKIVPLGKILSLIFSRIALSLGLSVAEVVGPLLLVIAVVYGIVFVVAKLVANFRLMRDEIGNIVTLIAAGLTDAIAGAIRGLGYLLSFGGKFSSISRGFNGLADRLNEGTAAARNNVYYTSVERTSQRQVENGGKDPYSDSGKNGFDAFDGQALRAGLNQLLGKAMPDALTAPDTVAAGRKLGEEIGKQVPKGDPMQRIAEMSAADRGRYDSQQAEYDRLMKEPYTRSESFGGGQTGEFGKPVIINLETGESLELRARQADAAKFESLAARTAKTRAGQTPAWGS